jgi:endonuclease YncB( thermonuclease family)
VDEEALYYEVIRAVIVTHLHGNAPQVSVDNANWTTAVSGNTTLGDIAEFAGLPQGNFTLWLRDTDVAGNSGTTSQASLVKDTVAPTMRLMNALFRGPRLNMITFCTLYRPTRSTAHVPSKPPVCIMFTGATSLSRMPSLPARRGARTFDRRGRRAGEGLEAASSGSPAPAKNSNLFDRLCALTGLARVVDGDTIRIQGVSVRLSGIDAPELSQLCGGASCGVAARAALRRLTHAKTVTCVEETRDRYKRIVGRCVADGVDLAAAMALAGHALAYRQYGSAYVVQERQAQMARAGMWAGVFDAPWDWRRAKREGKLAKDGAG